MDFNEKFKSVSESTTDTNHAINEIANGATSQAQETTDSKGRVDSIVESLYTQTSNTKALLSLIDNLNQSSRGAKETLEKLIQTFTDNNKVVNLVGEQTSHTKDSTNQITVAVGAISEIAEQTNQFMIQDTFAWHFVYT